jgi:predicted dehydrogenase
MKHVQVVCLVDPDMRTWSGRVKQVERRGGNTPRCVQDLRKALEDPSIDAVSVATCNHWHSLATIWACQAGKDVYVEKPCSHNLFEGRQCVAAARNYHRIVQHGTQKRSSSAFAAVAEAIASGRYGRLRVAKGYCCKPRWSIGFKPVRKPPNKLDFNLWLGPAPQQAYHENLVHYNWHWFWDTGNGDMGNQGVHEMDVARWGIPGATLPRSVISMGGRWVDGPGLKDQGQTPNMQLCVYDYDGTLLVFETRGLVARSDSQGRDRFPFKVANEFYFDDGKIVDTKFYPRGTDRAEPIPPAKGKPRSGEIFANFIQCVRSRRREDLYAEILEGHHSAALCHLGNISYRLGRQVPFAEAREALGDNPQVRDSVRTIEDNLRGALDVDPAKLTCCLGPRLEFDAQTEKFPGNDRATALLTRHYRQPFVVPAQV